MLKKLLFWLVLVPLVLVLALQLYFFAQIWWWVEHNPTSTSFMRQQLAALREKNPNARLQLQWVDYHRI